MSRDDVYLPQAHRTRTGRVEHEQGAAGVERAGHVELVGHEWVLRGGPASADPARVRVGEQGIMTIQDQFPCGTQDAHACTLKSSPYLAWVRT